MRKSWKMPVLLGAMLLAVGCEEDTKALNTLVLTPEVQNGEVDRAVSLNVGIVGTLDSEARLVASVSDASRAQARFMNGTDASVQAAGEGRLQTLEVTCLSAEEAQPEAYIIVYVTTDSDQVAGQSREAVVVCPATAAAQPQPAGITVNPVSGLVTSESGQSATFTVVLTSKPKEDVIITAKSFKPEEGVVSPESVTFTPLNWSIAQTFTVTGVDDTLQDGDVAYSILLGPAQSQDARYHQYVLPSVSVTNLDNEPPKPSDMTVTPEELRVYEGGSGEIRVFITEEPSAPVTVRIASQDTAEATVSPSTLTFTPSNYNKVQTVNVTALRDGQEDGEKQVRVTLTASSNDSSLDNVSKSVVVTTVDTEGGAGETVKIRAVAANITSGNNQSYDPGHGIRIFQAIKPDVVMIQEFNYRNNNDSAIQQMIQTAFGNGFYYHRGRDLSGGIPNGVISRWPIIESGYWASNVIKNRDWDWALIDLPGSKELLAVSLHLSTSDNAKEISPLTKNIQNKIAADKAKGLEYYVLVGGDFNSAATANGKNELRNVVVTSVSKPVDQKGDDSTNATRSKTLDLLFADRDLHYKEIDAKIGRNSYPHGHVFDSRVYSKKGELGDVSPVQANDSGATNMQHMAVIRDFQFVADE